MPYSADISRANPACFLFLIDQSASMLKGLAGQKEQLKMNAAADAVNRAIDTISQRCSQGMEVRDYFDIGIIAYGHAMRMPDDPSIEYLTIMGENEKESYRIHRSDPRFKDHWPVKESIISVFPGTSVESPFLPISRVAEIAELENRQVRESDGTGGAVEVTRKVPLWLRPHAGLETPMRQALLHVEDALGQWVADHPHSFPPIVIIIGDGESSDGDPEPAARRIMELSTGDGNALMFNCHLSENWAQPIQYPHQERGLPGQYARKLFRMSSIMPPGFRAHAETLDIRLAAESRCYVFNADLISMVQFLDIGTRAASNLH